MWNAISLVQDLNLYQSATTPSHYWPGSDGNEGVLRIPQSSSITGTSPSDCLVSYIGHSFFVGGGSYTGQIGFGLVGFYGISSIVGYLMPNPLYTYIVNIYELVWLNFMAYQPL